MNRLTVAIAVAAGVATVAITAAITSSQSSSLPLPQPVAAQAHPASGKAGGPTRGKAPATTTTVAPEGITTTTLAPLTGCTASVSNPSPTQGNTAETVTVTTAVGAVVKIVAQYARTKSSHTQPVGPTGRVQYVLPIAHAPVGMIVNISVTASLRGVTTSCPTSFTPVA